MLISAIDRWLDERGLVVDVEQPYYTVVLYQPPWPPLLSAEGTTLTEAFERMFALADERQRQSGERWTLRENPAFHVTTEHLDAVLEENDQFLGIQAGDHPRYAAYFVRRSDGGTSRALFGSSLEAIATSAATAEPAAIAPVSLGELERQYRALTGASFGQQAPASSSTHRRMRDERAGKKMHAARLRHRAMTLARMTSQSQAARALGVPQRTISDWLRAEQAPPPPLTYAEIAPIVEETGSLQAAADELGRSIEEVAHVYYRDERFVRRLPSTRGIPALALEVAREYGVREASRQFGIEEDAVRDALVAAELQQ